MRSTAPAEGANILLPFGLSCRNSDANVGLVAGCADCETLESGDTCGSCRRLWHGICPVPAVGFYRNLGGSACLEAWRDAIDLRCPRGDLVRGRAAGGGGNHGESEEEYGEEEWYEEEEWCEEEEWDGEEGAGGEDEERWSRGNWSKDRRGNWQWSVDSTAGKQGTRWPDAEAVSLES